MTERQPLIPLPTDTELGRRVEEAEKFLTTLWPTDVPGWLTLCVRKHGTDDFKVDSEFQIARSGLESCAAIAVRESFFGDVWLSVNAKRAQTFDSRRGRANEVVAVPGLWLDVDYGQVGHANPMTPPDEESAWQIIAACEVQPALVVHSGFGLQPYWLVTEPWVGDSDAWRSDVQLTEERLFTLAQQEASRKQWSIDHVTDLPRVLRVPGTLNWKTPESPVPVQLRTVDRALRYDREQLANWLEGKISLADRIHQSNGSSGGGSAGRSTDGEYGEDERLSDAWKAAPLDPVMGGCAWMRHCREEPGALSYDEWIAMLTVLGRCEDGDNLAHVWSSGDAARYSPEGTEEKLKEAVTNLGPYRCTTIEGLTGGKFCDACPSKGKLSGPLMLGRHAEKVPTAPLGIEEGSDAVTQHENAGYQPTDHGNARRFVDRYGSGMRVVPTKEGSWYVWDGVRWLPDEKSLHSYRARRTVLHIYDEVLEHAASDRARADGLAEWAKRSQAANRIEAAVRLAKSDPAITVLRTDFDRDDWLLNCLNGTLDLRTGELLPHRREDLITRVVPVSYDAGAECPEWEKYLARVQPDEEIRAFLQDMAGYTLSGSTDEKCFFMNYGGGHNGKTIFVETLSWLMGGYATAALKTLFVERRADTHTVDLAMIMGARMVTCGEELVAGERLAEGPVKAITGGDQMSARRMRENPVPFHPVAKIWLATNHKPRLTDVGDAMSDRLRLIPWAERIQPHEEVPKSEMHKRLRAEGAGILAWAIRGHMRWLEIREKEGKYQPPAVIQAAVKDYIKDEDVIGHFIDECLYSAEEMEMEAAMGEAESGWTATADLMVVYRWWWLKEGNDARHAFSQRRIVDELKTRGYFPKVVGKVRGWTVRVRNGPWSLAKQSAVGSI